MKKRIFSIIALTLAMVFTLSACDGCSSLPELSFTNAFYGGTGLSDQDPQPYYSETLTYDIDYAETFDGVKIDSKLKEDKNVNFEFSNGSYVSTLEVYKSFKEASETKGVVFESDIVDSLEENESHAFYLHTEFSIYAKYTIGEKVVENTESIITDAYFCKTALAFAPVYTQTKATYLQFYYSIGEVIKVETESKTTYQKESYSLWNKVTGNKASEEETTTIKYNYKTVIDNTQLLFALRNIEVEIEKVDSIPVVAPSYKEPTSLAINYRENTSIPYSKEKPLVYNYENVEKPIEVKHYRFYKNDAKETGATQHLFIQTKLENQAESGIEDYRALPIRYVEPLTTYGSFSPMGVLVFTLTNASIMD